MVERSLSMREVPGSMPGFSTFFFFFFFFFLVPTAVPSEHYPFAVGVVLRYPVAVGA